MIMEKLDVRFQAMDMMNSNSNHEDSFTIESQHAVINELQNKFGYLAEEINKVKGYFRVYTLGNNLNGNVQPIDFTPELLKKLHNPI